MAVSPLKFRLEGIDELSGKPRHRLDLSGLEVGKVYLIFFEKMEVNFAVINGLKALTFSKALHKIDFKTLSVGDLRIYVCSMPKEFAPACANVARYLNLEVRYVSQSVFVDDCVAVIPSSEKILAIREKACPRYSLILKERGVFTPRSSEEKQSIELLTEVGAHIDKISLD